MPAAPRPQTASVAPRPIVRGVAADEPSLLTRPARKDRRVEEGPLLPLPEQLGIGGPRPTPRPEVDWNTVHRRLRELGAVGSQMQRTPEGGYRFTCLLPTAEHDRTQRIDAEATTEGEAAQSALNRAEQWLRGR